MRKRFFILFFLGIFLIVTGFFIAVKFFAFGAWTLVQRSGGIEEYRLRSNGLRVLVLPDPSAPVAALMVSYPAGATQEFDGYSGAAHLLEHMMFKGTERYHQTKGTAIPQVLESTGAVINAYTSHDSTNYYVMIPNDQLPLALDIEADRMRNLRFEEKDFLRERGVVENELEYVNDDPLTALTWAVWKKAFRVHPYRRPVIGERNEVKSMSGAELRRFYDTYYWPDRAVLSVIGDFQTRSVLRDICRRFHAIPRSKNASTPFPDSEPRQEGPRRVMLTKEAGAQFVLITHKMPGMLHPDAMALDLLSLILSGGKTSRLYQRLVVPGLAVDVQSSVSGMKEEGLFTTLVTLAPSSTHEAVEKVVLEEYGSLANQGIMQEELSKVKNQLRMKTAFSRDGCLSVASELGYALSIGDWTHFTNFLAQAEAVTLEEIQRVSRHYLIQEGMTVGYLRAGQELQNSGMDRSDHSDHKVSAESPADYVAVRDDKAGSTVGDFNVLPGTTSPSFKNRVRFDRVHGVKVLSLQTGIKDAVTIHGSLGGAGAAYSENPVLARLVAQMLDKQTQGRAPFEIAKALENFGAQVSYGADAKRLRFTVRCLGRDLGKVLPLVIEQIRSPAFLSEEFERVREEETVGLRHALSSTLQQGFNAWAREVFPAGHPFYPATFQEQLAWLEKTRVEDLKDFHEKHFGLSEGCLAAVGDLDPENWAPVLEQSLKGWKSLPVEALPQRNVQTSLQPTSRLGVSVPGKVNIDIFAGHAMPLRRKDESYLAVYLANYILGGDFSARLSTRLRDAEGLTYAANSVLMGITEDIQGAWLMHMIVNPPLLGKAVDSLQDEVRSFVEQGVSAREVRIKQRTLIGRFKVGLATTGGMAGQLVTAEELGLGYEYLDHYPQLLGALSPSQVNEAIRRYYYPGQLRMVVSGNPEKGSA